MAAETMTAAAEPGSFGEVLSEALRYWEPRRIAYNLLLAGIVLGWVALTWPHFRAALTWPSLLPLFVLAVLANVCYCAAYLADIPLQYSAYRSGWRRWRWALWVLGSLLACALTYYWIADEIYPAAGQAAHQMIRGAALACAPGVVVRGGGRHDLLSFGAGGYQ